MVKHTLDVVMRNLNNSIRNLRLHCMNEEHRKMVSFQRYKYQSLIFSTNVYPFPASVSPSTGLRRSLTGSSSNRFSRKTGSSPV